MSKGEDVLARFTAEAAYRAAYSDTLTRMFAPITDALVRETRIQPGHAVLDVATGAGDPALSIARIVGPAGSVAGVDPVGEMIANATRAAEGAGLANTSFHTASAEQLPFPDSRFDAVVCRFGIMYFASPVQSVREMLRVTAPGGRLAFAVWPPADRNPFHCALAQVVDQYVAPETPPPDAPGPFRYAAPGKLLDVLKEGGATQASEQTVQLTFDVALSLEGYWALRLEMSEKFRKKLAALSLETQAAIREDVMRAHAAYVTPRGLSLPAEVLIVSGAKP